MASGHSSTIRAWRATRVTALVMIAQQPCQQRFLRVQTVFGLVEDRAGRAVEHLVGDLQPRCAGRQCSTMAPARRAGGSSALTCRRRNGVTRSCRRSPGPSTPGVRWPEHRLRRRLRAVGQDRHAPAGFHGAFLGVDHELPTRAGTSGDTTRMCRRRSRPPSISEWAFVAPSRGTSTSARRAFPYVPGYGLQVASTWHGWKLVGQRR